MMIVQRSDCVAQQTEPFTVGKSAESTYFRSSHDDMNSMPSAFTRDEDQVAVAKPARYPAACAAGNGSDALPWAMPSYAISQSLLSLGQDARVAGN